MTKPTPQPDMAWHLRRLLEAVKEAACGLEGRWRWLAGPLALLMRICTRRERREAAEAMRAVQGLLEAFLGLLEDFRAGRLKPEVDAEAEENRPDSAVACPASSHSVGPHRARAMGTPVGGRGIRGGVECAVAAPRSQLALGACAKTPAKGRRVVSSGHSIHQIAGRTAGFPGLRCTARAPPGAGFKNERDMVGFSAP